MSHQILVGKAQPTFTEVHVNRPLTDLSLGFVQNPDAFVARKVFPAVPVQKASDSYFRYGKEFWYKAFAEYRAPGTAAAVSGYSMDTAEFSCKRRAIAKEIPDPIRANADIADLDREATAWVMQQLSLKDESDWAAANFVTGVWGTTTTPSVLWNDTASTPIEEVRTGMRTVLSNTGMIPNVGVIGKKLYDVLCDHPDIIDRIKYGQTAGGPANVTPAAIAALFGLDRLLIARAVQNTAAEGAAASYSFIADQESLLLAYAAPNPGLMTASAGYTFVWSGAPGANSAGMAFRSFREDRIESDIVEGNSWYDHKIVASELGYFFLNATA